MSLALYRKYRPSKFSDVAGQEPVVRTLRNQLAAGTLAHAYLFTGPRGTGKTTIARILAKAANCTDLKEGDPCGVCAACEMAQAGNALDIIEIDAASNTQVEKVRDVIVEGVRFAPTALKRKVYIIDEVHMLSAGSFNALLKTLEEPPAHALFILATTEIHKVPATVISRCQRFDFRRIPAETIVQTLKSIAKQEGVKVEDEVLSEVARHADGGLRDAQSVFGQILAIGEGKITMREAALVLPASSAVKTFEVLEALAARDAAAAVRTVNTAAEDGLDMPHLVDDLIDALRASMLLALGGSGEGNEQFDAAATERLRAAATSLGAARAADAIRRLSDARRHMKGDKIPQLSLEVALVELCMGASAPVAAAKVAAPPVAPPPTARPLAAAPKPAPIAPPIADEIKPKKADLVPPPPIASEAPVTAPSAFGGAVPVLSVEDVRAKWPDVFQMLKGANASLPIVIKAGDVTAVDGDRIEVSFAYAMHADMVNQERNRKILDPVLERVYGKSVYVRGKYVHAESDETVSMLLQEFGGSAA